MLGFFQAEWLGDPILSGIAGYILKTMITGTLVALPELNGVRIRVSIRGAFRRSVWVHAEAKVARDEDGLPAVRAKNRAISRSGKRLKRAILSPAKPEP